jgi:hypothetical protein
MLRLSNDALPRAVTGDVVVSGTYHQKALNAVLAARYAHGASRIADSRGSLRSPQKPVGFKARKARRENSLG